MDADTLARARGVVEGLRDAEAGATPGPWAAGWNGNPEMEGLDAAGPLGIVAMNRGQVASLVPNRYGDAKTWGQVEANASAIVALRNAAPALLALAGACAALADGYQGAPWWEADAAGAYCIGCGVGASRAVRGQREGVFDHAADCPALAIDAALADLAALAADGSA